MSDVDYPDNGEPPLRSALTFPPCVCGNPGCPDTDTDTDTAPGADDKQLADSRTEDRAEAETDYDRSCSPTMRRVRGRMRDENQMKRRGRA
ncbi:hypothetical protein [Streptomyces sp. NPDC088725]|uniref:hypothetical protein n=1 Tax=Streptomyces sp. NPDC088725 TaxID=3365873 RepID=UPI003807E9C7